jgi:hypothetical protein
MYRRFFRPMGMPVLCAAVAAIGLLAAPAAASAAVHPAQTRPAARFASEATAYQNKVIERALARVPDGTRISASEVKWPNGAVLGVAASTDQTELSDCLDAQSNGLAFCAFTSTNYTGNWLSLPQLDTDSWFNWGSNFPSQGTSSYYNALEYRVWREQFKNSGNELCISPWGDGNYTDSNYYGPDKFDRWILTTTNSAPC